MKVFVELDFTDEELIQLKHLHCHQQVIFISDVFDASGKALDRKYLTRRCRDETWSMLIFLQENPPNQQKTSNFGGVCYIIYLQGGGHRIGWAGSWRRGTKSGSGNIMKKQQSYC
jgi:hypothetical protein